MRIFLRAEQPELMPVYKTRLASGADLKAKMAVSVLPWSRAKVPTGVYLDLLRINEELELSGFGLLDLSRRGKLPELQVRLRSGISHRSGLMPTNGVGTIDLDYEGEICVLVFNPTSDVINIMAGERIAQLVLATSAYIDDLEIDSADRLGGFGHTG